MHCVCVCEGVLIWPKVTIFKISTHCAIPDLGVEWYALAFESQRPRFVKPLPCVVEPAALRGSDLRLGACKDLTRIRRMGSRALG